ncbi:MAG: tRNA adenosine(34) deaminase TadA [Oceanospirillales bacterium]|uniref:tRNA-specific adenosine deaminase n=1 Tax=Marinobacterium halophilum TaxID=267374 RepID=A0A2P8F155_9GAMM|nr:tRNA adenosine(34) deaminase TadA [Marinobacterium halophilum]MBR9827578.1 tRNA adenosine(34) deaminase TadA [Oceanospirillales bacterium]PSL15446.1 tRNA(adenine34) deaminase [Marinobacterium halophilum]
MEQDQFYMQRALQLAQQAADLGEVPVGAVIVRDGQVIGEGWNRPISGHDPTAHAEIMALREAAAQVGNYRLVGAELYVTLEPCTMCAGAIVHARIERVIFGTTEPKAGALVSNQQLFDQPWVNHRPDYRGGVLADDCATMISDFFRRRREHKRQQKQQRQLPPSE